MSLSGDALMAFGSLIGFILFGLTIRVSFRRGRGPGELDA